MFFCAMLFILMAAEGENVSDAFRMLDKSISSLMVSDTWWQFRWVSLFSDQCRDDAWSCAVSARKAEWGRGVPPVLKFLSIPSESSAPFLIPGKPSQCKAHPHSHVFRSSTSTLSLFSCELLSAVFPNSDGFFGCYNLSYKVWLIFFFLIICKWPGLSGTVNFQVHLTSFKPGFFYFN